MYNAFAKKYPALALDLNTDIEVFPVSSLNHQGTTVYAIWDTGASQTVITHRLMSHLNLIPIETKLVHGINSKQMVDVVAISLKLPNGLLIPDIRVFVCDIPSPIDLLIGMDIIQLGDFHISNTGGRTLFSFVVPPLPEQFDLTQEADVLNNKGD
ncbi:MAG: retropepsin-like domain-containing protein [Treponema sp.]|nr:retropepsin-like domain-containing protein [Treponema sp.]